MSAAAVWNHKLELLSPKMYGAVMPTLEQRGLDFFIQRYLMRNPEAPQTAEQLAVYSNRSDAMQSVMLAVGLAGLSNIQGDRAMNLLSRQKYTLALRQTGQLISTKPSDPLSLMAPLRAVVTLALFEVATSRLQMNSHQITNLL